MDVRQARTADQQGHSAGRRNATIRRNRAISILYTGALHARCWGPVADVRRWPHRADASGVQRYCLLRLRNDPSGLLTGFAFDSVGKADVCFTGHWDLWCMDGALAGDDPRRGSSRSSDVAHRESRSEAIRVRQDEPVS